MREMRVPSLLLLLALLGVAAYAGRFLRIRATDHYLATQTYEDVYYVPPARFLPVLALGFDEAAADLLWMRALVYFGDELKERGQVRHVFEYADAIITLDPQFVHAYRWVGTAGMYRPNEVSVEDIRRSVSYLERAAELFPEDGDLAWDTGASLAYELAPRIEDPEEKREIKARGVQYMETAARLGAGPPWLALTNASELERLGNIDQAIRHLEEVYGTTRDESARREIELRLSRLRTAAYAEAFERAYQELEAQRAEDFPYLDDTMYLIVGPRPLVDEGALLSGRFAPAAPSLDTDD